MYSMQEAAYHLRLSERAGKRRMQLSEKNVKDEFILASMNTSAKIYSDIHPFLQEETCPPRKPY